MVSTVSFVWILLLLFGASADRTRGEREERAERARAPRRARDSSATGTGIDDSQEQTSHTDSFVEEPDETLEPGAVNSTPTDFAVAPVPSPDGLDGDAIVGGIDIKANPGEAGQANAATSTALDANGNPIDLQRKTLQSLGSLPRRFPCAGNDSLDVSDIRSLSDSWMAGGTARNRKGFSNMLWSFGQFIDHDIVGTVEDLSGPSYTIEMAHNDRTGSMVVHRLEAPPDANGCPTPENVHTARIDGGPVYGTNETYLNMLLREPNSCRLRESASQLLPITSSADEKGRFFFIAGDLRVDEHGLLTCMHTVWMREHNRLCDEIAASQTDMSTDAQFNLTRKVVEAKLQQITMAEFLPALGITEAHLRSAPSHPDASEFVTVEFSTAAFRFGHDLVPDLIGDFKTADIFNGEDFFLEHRDGGFAMRDDAGARLNGLLEAAARSLCADRDGMLSDTLRNVLFGTFGHDLAARNIFRARDMRLPSYADLAAQFGVQPDPQIASMVKDAFIGMLQEADYDEASVVGRTTRAILLEQFQAIFFGPEGLWWQDSPAELAEYAAEVAGTTLGKVIRSNTGADVKDDVFRV